MIYRICRYFAAVALHPRSLGLHARTLSRDQGWIHIISYILDGASSIPATQSEANAKYENRPAAGCKQQERSGLPPLARPAL
jgi:hypothetical protein